MDDDGGGRIAEPSEEEYDALNDETFGSAINGDWEEVHENLVRLTGDGDTDGDSLASGAHGIAAGDFESLSSMKNNQSNVLADSDLELNLSGMKLDDVDLSYGDNESMIGLLGDEVKMDPSVWSLGVKDRTLAETANSAVIGNTLSSNPEEFLREHFPTPFQQHHNQQKNESHEHHNHQLRHELKQQPQNHPIASNQFPLMMQPLQQQQLPKICTLEDIERNMILQQSKSKLSHAQQQQQHDVDMIAKQKKILHDILSHSSETPTPIQQSQQLQQHSQHGGQHHQQQQQFLSHQYSVLLSQKGNLQFGNLIMSVKVLTLKSVPLQEVIIYKIPINNIQTVRSAFAILNFIIQLEMGHEC